MALWVLTLIPLVLPNHVRGHLCHVSGTSADCHDRGLIVVPTDLPSNLTSLDLSHNKITQLIKGSFDGLGRLTELSLRNNNICEPYSFQNGAVFQPLVALRFLDLGENQLTEVGNHSFSGLRQLQRLLLDHNLLQRLQPCAFCGLASLRHLQLQANQLHSGNESYLDDAFAPLKNLTTLDISQNSVQDSLYSEVTSLTVLEKLTLDLLEDPLPDDYSALGYLTSLTLKVQKWTGNVSKETFSSLAEVPLKHLQLTGQDLYFLHRDAFQPVSQHLQQLEVVDLPSLSLPVAIAALHVFQGRNMTRIRLEGVSNFDYHMDDLEKHTIDTNSCSILSKVCAEELNLARNAVTNFAWETVHNGCLTTTLKHFDFSGNYLPLVPKQQLIFLYFQALEYLDLSTEKGWREPSRHFLSEAAPSLIKVRLAPTLSYLNISHCILPYGKMPSSIVFENASNVRTVDISYCGGTDFIYPIQGLENMTTFDISGNDLSNVDLNMLDNFDQIKHLSMRDSSLDPQVLMRHGIRFFTKARNLEYIDLSENRLNVLPRGVFLNLKEVILSVNYFSSIPLEVDTMPRLGTLDLTFNSITFLTRQEQEQLDARAQSSDGDFRLLLEGNPLSCDCSVLDFVSWLSTTSVRLDRGGNYTCLTDGDIFTNTAEVGANLDRKWQQCVGSWWLGMSSALLVVTLMTLVLAFLLARFWTNVQHVVLRMMGFGHALLRRADFRYDVYVAYSDEDYRFACLDLLPLLEADGLRVLVRDRDEPVGVSRAEEVVRAVGKSWRIVFLLTEAFLRDEWCQFTALTAARCSASPHESGRVLLVLLRPLPRADLPPSLLTVVEEQDVFDLGGDHPGPALWGRLLHRLREQ